MTFDLDTEEGRRRYAEAVARALRNPNPRLVEVKSALREALYPNADDRRNRDHDHDDR